MTKNSVVRLAQRPTGPARQEDFDIRQEDLPEPGDGEFRVKSAYISLDPAMRGWMNEAKSYVPPVGIGDVMRGFAAGHVEASRHPGFKEGDAITGLFGVQEYGISDGQGVSVADTSLPVYALLPSEYVLLSRLEHNSLIHSSRECHQEHYLIADNI